MAYRNQAESPRQALAGDFLLVVHDFQARGPDELSLSKGDRIELVERDDDFGDGWYLGKQTDGRTGLFPEVYTKLAPRLPGEPTRRASNAPNVPATYPSAPAPSEHTIASVLNEQPQPPMPASAPLADTPLPPYESEANTPPPLNTTTPSTRTVSAPATSFPTQDLPSSPVNQRSMSLMVEHNRGHGEESPVMNETLSVIEEHITDMNTPRSSLLATDVRHHNDSGSEYSNHIDHRLSYINGHETDEEESGMPSEAEVMTWPPKQVAQYLQEIGVERRHCDVFKEQEISGEVLLSIDQASIFMKEFDLGVVGRRLRTWHKIKSFQEEVRATKGGRSESRMAGGSIESFHQSSTQGSMNGSVLPRIPSLNERSPPIVRHSSEESPVIPQEAPRITAIVEKDFAPPTPTVQSSESPSRPSAASIREMSHSRRHSSIDVRAKTASPSSPEVTKPMSPPVPTASAASHRKGSSSFDRGWTMSGNQPHNRTSAAIGLSALGMTSHALTLSTDRNTFDPTMLDPTVPLEGPKDIDRDYASDMESRRYRNVLRKKDPTTSHSRQSSYNERNLTVGKRHSRFGSGSSIRDTLSSMTNSGTRHSPNDPMKSRTRTLSLREGNTAQNSSSPPMVTKLDYSESPPSTSDSPAKEGKADSFLKARIGFRSNSDAVTPSEKTLLGSGNSLPSPIKESHAEKSDAQPPSRTGSTTASGTSKSFDADSIGASSKGASSATIGTNGVTPMGSKRGKGGKKDTSAYIRGLIKQTPAEAALECDYSGWMKKKSASLTSTWKPRLFVLRGRRLSYYYTESDIVEKGLIDISSHRVLPADNEFLTSLHATVTGAKASPSSPPNAQTPTMNAEEAAGQVGGGGAEGMFIFKLVPPRTGLSRAVSFTKPAVHYFAVDNITQGRLWMAALMKATIDRDESKPVTTTYQQKTISLAKAKAMRQRPPALMNVDEKLEGGTPNESAVQSPVEGENALNIQGLNLSYEYIPSTTPNQDTAENGSGEPHHRPAPAAPGSAPLLDQQVSPDPNHRLSPALDQHSNSVRMVRSMSAEMNEQEKLAQGKKEPYERTQSAMSGSFKRQTSGSVSNSMRPRGFSRTSQTSQGSRGERTGEHPWAHVNAGW